MSEAARIAALKAAVELRTATSTVAQILEVAQAFETYLRGPMKPAEEISPRMVPSIGDAVVGAMTTPGKGASRAPAARS